MPAYSEATVSKGRQKPPTRLYEDNYGYAFNFYQPMIEYLDSKEKKLKPKEYPHLPWNNERGLDRYSSRNLFRSYTEQDLHKLAEKAEQQAKENLKNFKLAKRTNFSISKSASAASVTKHIKQVTLKKVKSYERIQDMAEDGLILEDENLTDRHQFAQEFLRGKSAKGIEAHILAESLKNVSSNTGIDIKAFQRRAELSSHDSQQHVHFMECRKKMQNEDTSITQPLNELKVELKGFNKKTSEYFEEKRYQNVAQWCIKKSV
jgi:hypothetical protein